MISRFVLSREALAAFPPDLLDGSRETLRMAERIVRQLGFEDLDDVAPLELSKRLSWAILAVEDGEPEDEGTSPPRS